MFVLHIFIIYVFLVGIFLMHLTNIGIMLTWSLTKSTWLQVNVKIKTNLLTELGLRHSKVPFLRDMP